MLQVQEEGLGVEAGGGVCVRVWSVVGRWEGGDAAP